MKKSMVILTALCSLFLGVVIGFLISPIKKGIEIGNNSGNTTTTNIGDDAYEEEEGEE